MLIHGDLATCISAGQRIWPAGSFSTISPASPASLDPNTVTSITGGTASSSNEHSVIAGDADTENSIVYVGGTA